MEQQQQQQQAMKAQQKHQQQQQPIEQQIDPATTITDQEPPLKKIKLAAFPRLSATATAQLRTYISSQIKVLLGQEEASLIDYCCSLVETQTDPQAAIPELEQVLDEDAALFWSGLCAKVQELHEQDNTQAGGNGRVKS
jgi:hypothetical protein